MQLGPIEQCRFEDHLFNPLGADPTQAKYPCGSISIIDHEVRFSCARPSAYVTMCDSPKCNLRGSRKGIRNVLEPIHNIDFARASGPTLQAEGPRLESTFRPFTTGAWCIIYKGPTEPWVVLLFFVNTSARWMIGNIRPFYIERAPRCLSWK